MQDRREDRREDRRAAETARRIARRAIDLFPPTLRGLTLGLLCGLAFWLYGYGRLDLIAFVLGAAGLALLLITSAITSGAALLLRRRLDAFANDPAHLSRSASPRTGPGRGLEAGERITTGLVLPALDRVPLLDVELFWSWPDDCETRLKSAPEGLSEEVIPHRRCEVDRVERAFVVRDVFGLSRIAIARGSTTSLRVLPHPGRLRYAPIVPSFAAAEGIPHPAGTPEGDRMEIRRYVPGDSPRDLLWKTYARTHQLNVRRPERSIDRLTRTVAYLVAGEEDEAAAAAARVALETGALGREFRFGADGTRGSVERIGEALQAIARSGSLAPRTATGFPGFLREVGRKGQTHCIAFVPGEPGEWLEPVARAAAGAAAPVSFVVATDGVARTRRASEPRWWRWLFETADVAGTPISQLDQVVNALATTGASVTVVDRSTGKSWIESQGALSTGMRTPAAAVA